jgi:tetratricopeptide (TPR) repeat protein
MIWHRSTTGSTYWLIASLVFGLLTLVGCGRDQRYADALKQLKNDQFDEALPAFHKLITENPKNAKALYHRGLTYDSRGELSGANASTAAGTDYDTAVKEYTAATKDYGLAISDYSAALDLDKEIVQARNSGDKELKRQYRSAVSLRDEELQDPYKEEVPLPAKPRHFHLRWDPTRARALTDLAEVYIKKGTIHIKLAADYQNQQMHSEAQAEYDQAIGDFTQAIERRSSRPEAWCGRGIALLEKGFFAPAIADLTRAMELKPEYAEALRERARARVLSGKPEQAVEDGEHAIRLDPGSATVCKVLGSAYLATGQFQGAVACFEEASWRDPNLKKKVESELGEALYGWAKALHKESKDKEAEERIGRAVTIDKEYGKRWEEYLEQAPKPKSLPEPQRQSDRKKAEIFYRGGLDHLKKREFDEALDAFAEALQIYPEFPQAHYGRGMVFLEQGFSDKAIEEFKLAIDLNPDYAYAHLGLGVAFLELGFPDTAIEVFRQAIDLNRDCAEAYCGRCRAYTLMQDYSRAVDDGTQAIRLRPGYAETYFQRGRAYLGKKDFQRAIADLERAAFLDQNLGKAVKPPLAEAYRGRGLDELGKKDWDAAIDDLRQALQIGFGLDLRRLNRELADGYRGRGLELASYRVFDKALRDLSEAVDRDPANAENYEARGLTYVKMAGWNEAIADLEQANRRDTEHAYRRRRSLGRAYYHRAMIHQEAGRLAEAQADFARAKRLGWNPGQAAAKVSTGLRELPLNIRVVQLRGHHPDLWEIRPI